MTTTAYRALDEELRRLLPSKKVGLNLIFNHHVAEQEDPYVAYRNYVWASQEEKDQAIAANSVWTVELFGHGIEPSVPLAASSIDGVVRLLKGKREVILANRRRERSKAKV